MKNGQIAYLNTNWQITISSINISFYDFKEKLYYSVISSIIPTNCNGKECYYVSFGTESMYIDKETGLTTRVLSNDTESSTITDYIYEFNTVTEDIFEEPDISEYTIKE